MRQAPEILLPILVIPEDGRPLVPPDDDVVNPSRKLQPRRPGHHKILQDFRTDPIHPQMTFAGANAWIIPAPSA